MKMNRFFTVTYPKIVNKLITPINIMANGKTIQTTALWDTGATNCCIAQEIIGKLNLTSISMVSMLTPSGQASAKVYNVDIKLPNNVYVQDAQVIESEISKQGIGLLIGMDIINYGEFAISNYDGKTKFTFRLPSKEDIDFGEENNT